VDFDLSEMQASWKARGRTLARQLDPEATASDVVAAAARVGLKEPPIDLMSAVAATEAMAYESVSTATTFALHTVGVLSLAGHDGFSDVIRGEHVAALSLSSSEESAVERERRLSGRAAWVAPMTAHGVAIVGARVDGDLAAFAVRLDSEGVAAKVITTAALRGLVCSHVVFTNTPCVGIGPTTPIMARMRLLISAVGLGIGRRALREALATARAAGELNPGPDSGQRAAGEQTVQGLLADAATELDAGAVLTWRGASAGTLSLAEASMAKLAVTAAAQRAVERATQVVGGMTLEAGQIIERLAQDVRALELFAGRTEALRAAVAEEILPTSPESASR
jgi:alkylation response protein AidB-like acyl-CoA dehydrogenase